MPEISRYAQLFERLQSLSLHVDEQRCLAVRNRNTPCGRCAAACASGCIHLKDNDIAVNPEKCIGCGTCASACPTEAIAPKLPDDRELALAAAQALAATREKMAKTEAASAKAPDSETENTKDASRGAAVFACASLLEAAQRKLDPDTVVALSCLGRIDESLLAVLAAAGATDIYLVHGACETCAYAPGFAMARTVSETANTLFATWNAPTRVHVQPRFPSVCKKRERAPYNAARREFLLGAKSAAQTAAHETTTFAIDDFFDAKRPGMAGTKAPHVTLDGTLPHRVPRRRELLLDALAACGNPEDELIGTRLWGHVIIDADACRSCRMCAVFCPTGALAKCDDGREVGIVHAPGACVKCRTCEQLCPSHALSISEEVFAVDIHAGYVEKCIMRNVSAEKSGPDAIRNSMSKLIDTKYLWG